MKASVYRELSVWDQTSDTFYPAALFMGIHYPANRPWRSADTSKQVSQSAWTKVSDIWPIVILYVRSVLQQARARRQYGRTFTSTDCGGSQPNAMGWHEATHKVCCRIKRMFVLTAIRELA